MQVFPATAETDFPAPIPLFPIGLDGLSSSSSSLTNLTRIRRESSSCEHANNKYLCLPPTYSKFELPHTESVNVVEIGIDISDVLRINDKVGRLLALPQAQTQAQALLANRRPLRRQLNSLRWRALARTILYLGQNFSWSSSSQSSSS